MGTSSSARNSSAVRCVSGSKLRIGFKRVAEKVEPHRRVDRRRKQIDNTAAHGIVAGLAHGRGAIKAVKLEPLRDARHRQEPARRGGQRLPRHGFARRHALQDGVDGGQKDCWLVAFLAPGEP